MINKIILKSKKLDGLTNLKEFVCSSNEHGACLNEYKDVSQVDIVFFGVKFNFKNTHGSLSVTSSDANMILKPCDGNNLNLTSEDILFFLREEVKQKDKLATFRDLDVTRFGKQRKVQLTAESLVFEIDELTFEVTCFNDGNIRISSVDHSKIKLAPQSKNSVLITSHD